MKTDFEPGYVYAPYIPMTTTDSQLRLHAAIKLIREMDKYLDTNKSTYIASGSIFHQEMKDNLENYK